MSLSSLLLVHDVPARSLAPIARLLPRQRALSGQWQGISKHQHENRFPDTLKATSTTRTGNTRGREEHKIFDEVIITCKSGRGGNGEIAAEGTGKLVKNYKYSHNSGTGGPKRRKATQKQRPALLVPVPMGTIVKLKNGTRVADLVRSGDVYCVCKGGRGGRGTIMPSSEKQTHRPKTRKLKDKDIEIFEVEDANWAQDARGEEGEEKPVMLQLRMVADAGILGLPNVGKSTLLRCLTMSNAQVANYPFTTLMPNLGVLTPKDRFSQEASQSSVLVDLPGLIEGAHTGRGLGRMFLRHLTRTRVLVHILDAAAENPSSDYWVVREELRMFNPEYCKRPCLVVLNKMDLPDAGDLKEELVSEIWQIAQQLHDEHPDTHSQPVDVLCCSALDGSGLPDVAEAIRNMLTSDADILEDDIVDWDTSLPEY